MRRRIGGIVLTVTGILACPCHLIITLPLLTALFAGTALGSFLTHNTGLVYGGAAIYFVVALVLGVRFLLGSNRPPQEVNGACSTCGSVEIGPSVQEPSALPNNLPITRR